MAKILVVSYYFHPEIAPRAFRTYGLVKELAQQGHEVKAVIPDYGIEYPELKNVMVRRIRSGYFLNRNAKSLKVSAKTNKKKFGFIKLKRIISRFFIGPSIEYAMALFFVLRKEKGYDMVVSVGLPIAVHIGVAAAGLFSRRAVETVTVADYGDPFSRNPQMPRSFYLRWLEKRVLCGFDIVTVPVKEAISAFSGLMANNRIKVIPQGIDISAYKPAEYKAHDIPTFAYAGLFYPGIRNPKILFDFLSGVAGDFRFIIYTNTAGRENMDCIEPNIIKIRDKVVIKDMVSRKQCIKELSRMDFLINQDNLGGVQSPSKLQDYAAAGRPVFSFDQEHFDADKLKDFLSGDYSGAVKYNIMDMKEIAMSFLNLIKGGIKNEVA